MKTTDGYEASKGKHYYTGEGQEVILEECVVSSSGKSLFSVVPIYEGEAMSVNCDGGSHHEITVDYEHEGNLILIESLFNQVPLEKLENSYKTMLDQIVNLSLALGEIKKRSNELCMKKIALERETKILERLFNTTNEKKNKLAEELNILDKSISVKKQIVVELEDYMSTTGNGNVNQIIGVSELRRLKKRDFELRRLKKRDFELQCLENGGVDNWTWYSESLKPFQERYPNN